MLFQNQEYKYKLQTIFSIQKRCIRLLFGKVCNYDHSEFYETCIDEHRAPKDYCFEHTKPIFNEKKFFH